MGEGERGREGGQRQRGRRDGGSEEGRAKGRERESGQRRGGRGTQSSTGHPFIQPRGVARAGRRSGMVACSSEC